MVIKVLSSAELTRQQELGSAWIFRRALKDNMRYSRWEDILEDPKYDELGGAKGIYPTVDKDWLKTFFLQQKTMLQEFSNPQFTEFNREYGFMKFISDLVKNKFGISKKDSWDPADIWCIKNEDKVINEIKKIVEKNEYETITELNVLLRTYFKKKIIVGVSLKKVSGKQALYEEINVENDLEYLNKDYTFDVSQIKIDLSMKPGREIKLGTQDTTIFVDAIEGDKKITYKYQITTISSSRFNNLKFEPTSSAATAARLGKAPVDMVIGVFDEFGVNFSNSNKDYPQTAAQFKEIEEDIVKMFNTVKKKANTVITDEKQFVQNMTKIMIANPPIGNSKLMQLTLVYELVSLKKEDLNRVMTKITMLAQKKGAQFGPFGKLY
jgi:hypothetical protein